MATVNIAKEKENMNKLKFEFNHLEKTLYIHQPGSPRQAITKTFTTNWEAPGFILEPTNHWITFTVYPNKIRAFYKCVKEENSEQVWPSELDWKDWKVSADTLAPVVSEITFYLKDLSKETNPIIFTFTTQDEVQKLNGSWVKKHVKI